MSFPYQQNAFTLGEVSPSLFGRQDTARLKVGASTMRNLWPKFSGGAYSRAGTAFVGFSKQTGGSGFPPRLIPFQFSINQGLVLEFGHFYMRVISNGAYVTDQSLPISSITNGNPALLTVPVNGLATATPINGGVTQSYTPGDSLTLAGGVFASPAVLQVASTQLLSIVLASPGGGYVPADTIHVTGGTQSTAVILTVATTQVVSATVTAAGTGGANGIQVVTGTTGTGTKFQATVTVASGAISAINSILVGGSYTVNPTAPAAEPVTGAGLTGATLNVVIGVNTLTITNPGIFTANAVGGNFTQASTTGSGVGATFGGALMGVHATTALNVGSYSVFPANPVAVALTSGIGVGATFTCTFFAGAQTFNNGDWVRISGVNGMTEINGITAVVTNATPAGFTLFDVYGNAINTTSFTPYLSGGTASRIYTTPTPYNSADLEFLKFTQSADVMSICCVNQNRNFPYAPFDLTRFSDTSWTFTQVSPGPNLLPPGNITATSTGSGIAYYAYVVTSVAANGSESLPSGVVHLFNAVNIAVTQGTNVINWSPAALAVSYNVYKAEVLFNTVQATGVPYGLIATTTGTQFGDAGQVPDFNTTPPQFQNPFSSSNNFPSTVSYFQERRVYANTLNQPDTYFMSQPGRFTNFDTRVPTIDSDAITGTPWAVQVDGVQFLVDMPGGLVVLTGREAWQLTGAGGSSLNPVPVTPAAQQAQPQAFNGCSATVPPIKIDYDIMYVQAKGSIVRDLSYQFYQNIYTGNDLTLNSSQLFTGYQILQWAWAEEPYKILWAVRNDGVLLSLTFVKPEQIAAWARHDTNGIFVSVASVTELPVDAIYCAVQRQIGVHTAYTIERMDNRIWNTIDDCWCVDCGRALAQPEPAATLTIGSLTAIGVITSPTVLNGGSGWTAGTQVFVVDDNGNGPGSGAAITPVIVGGVITGLTVSGGTGYVRPQFYAVDPAGSEGGSGFTATCTLGNLVTLTASPGIFIPDSVGSVVRAAGGAATIITFASATTVTANITQPFVTQVSDTIGASEFAPITQGNWTMTAPVTTISGLDYLIGATVTGVADGQVIAPQVVSPKGTITLAAPASNVVVGLGFTAQLQSLYADPPGNPTEQGQRKKIAAVTARMEGSRAFTVGANQPDGSTLSPLQVAPAWSGLTVVPDQSTPAFRSTVIPLWTGDVRIPLPGGFNTKGQVALEQKMPLPMNCLSLIPEDWPGDTPQMKEPQQQQGQRQQVPA